MPSEYDDFFAPATGEDDLEPVRERFRSASRPFLSSPWPWLAWAVLLPGLALATPAVLRAFGPAGVLFAWSAAILIGGAAEMLAIRRAGARGSPLATWAFRVQGNLSVVAVLLSILLLWQDTAWALPGLWLLLLGHSFYMLGGLTFLSLRLCGLLYQLGGVVALWPYGSPLLAFAVATAAGNLWMAVAVWRERREPRSR